MNTNNTNNDTCTNNDTDNDYPTTTTTTNNRTTDTTTNTSFMDLTRRTRQLQEESIGTNTTTTTNNVDNTTTTTTSTTIIPTPMSNNNSNINNNSNERQYNNRTTLEENTNTKDNQQEQQSSLVALLSETTISQQQQQQDIIIEENDPTITSISSSSSSSSSRTNTNRMTVTTITTTSVSNNNPFGYDNDEPTPIKSNRSSDIEPIRASNEEEEEEEQQQQQQPTEHEQQPSQSEEEEEEGKPFSFDRPTLEHSSSIILDSYNNNCTTTTIGTPHKPKHRIPITAATTSSSSTVLPNPSTMTSIAPTTAIRGIDPNNDTNNDRNNDDDKYRRRTRTLEQSTIETTRSGITTPKAVVAAATAVVVAVLLPPPPPQDSPILPDDANNNNDTTTTASTTTINDTKFDKNCSDDTSSSSSSFVSSQIRRNHTNDQLLLNNNNNNKNKTNNTVLTNNKNNCIFDCKGDEKEEIDMGSNNVMNNNSNYNNNNNNNNDDGTNTTTNNDTTPKAKNTNNTTRKVGDEEELNRSFENPSKYCTNDTDSQNNIIVESENAVLMERTNLTSIITTTNSILVDDTTPPPPPASKGSEMDSSNPITDLLSTNDDTNIISNASTTSNSNNTTSTNVVSSGDDHRSTNAASGNSIIPTLSLPTNDIWKIINNNNNVSSNDSSTSADGGNITNSKDSNDAFNSVVAPTTTTAATIIKNRNFFSNFLTLAANPSLVFTSSVPDPPTISSTTTVPTTGSSSNTKTNTTNRRNENHNEDDNDTADGSMTGLLGPQNETNDPTSIITESQRKHYSQHSRRQHVQDDDSLNDDYSTTGSRSILRERDNNHNIGDDDDDNMSHEQRSRDKDSIPNLVEYHSEFEIQGPLVSTWYDPHHNNDTDNIIHIDDDGTTYCNNYNNSSRDENNTTINSAVTITTREKRRREKIRNCYGIVHVRIIRAQRLSCPVHSDVHAIVSLPPWKGKVRSKTTKAFSGPDIITKATDDNTSNNNNHESTTTTATTAIQSGVCAVWDEDKVPPISMIHNASNDEGTVPIIPSIQIELAFCPLGLTFVELTMCTIQISCLPLFEEPFACKRQWFVIPPSSGTKDPTKPNETINPTVDDANKTKRSPAVEVRKQSEQSTTSSIGSIGTINDDDDRNEEASLLQNINKDELKNNITSKQVHRWPAIEIEAMFEPLENAMDDFSGTDDILALDSSHLSEDSDKFTEFDHPTHVTTAPDLTTNSLNVMDFKESQQPGDDDGDDDETTTNAGDSVVESKFPFTPISPKRGTVKRHNSSFSRTSFGLLDRMSGLEGSISGSSITRSDYPRKEHLIRTITYWTPAVCCVCKRSIMAGLWRSKAYHCEECNIDCCSDCRLQVDIQLPCGSEIASRTLAETIQRKLTVDNIMNVVAPVVGGIDDNTLLLLGENDAGETTETMESNNNNITNPSAIETIQKQSNAMVVDISRGKTTRNNDINTQPIHEGIGVMKMNFVRAYILKDPLSVETEAKEILDMSRDNNTSTTIANSSTTKFRPGDYYIRVTWTGGMKSARTRTVQSAGGRPKFRTNELRFTVKDYGTVFRIDVIDATTDKPVGTSVLTTQGVLQEQRDFLIEEKGMPYLYFLMQGPLKFEKVRRTVIELRTGLNETDFFSHTKQQQTTSATSETKTRPGDVVGCIELLVGFEEDLDSLYGNRPYICPPRPGDELNMTMFQVHIARVVSLIDDIKNGVEMGLYIVSWKNPLLTVVSLYFFIRLVLVFDPSYIGSFPVFLIILWMIYLAVARSFGKMKHKFIQKEIEANRKAQNVTVDYSIHRPVGLVRASILKGKNIRSPELGLPGNVGCRLYWDPTRYMTPKSKEKFLAIDKSARSVFDIGSTNYVYSINPEWGHIVSSQSMKRLRQLIPSKGNFFDASTNSFDNVIDLPVLQPFRKINDESYSLESWNQSGAAFVVEIKFNDVLSVVPGSEYSVGEVSIPFADIVQAGKVSGWFHIINQDAGFFPTLPSSDIPNRSEQPPGLEQSEEQEHPQIFIELKWIPPSSTEEVSFETEAEASIVIQEELVKYALLNSNQKLNIVDSSIGAFNTMKGLSGNLLLAQNTLGSCLDIIEHFVQCLNFTDPFKSSVVLGSLIVVWVVLSLIPTRAIILIAGLSLYASSFHSRFIAHVPDSDRVSSIVEVDLAPDADNNEQPVIVTWLLNAFRGLPTTEDLRKTYFWESRRIGARERDRYTTLKRQQRMDRLWRVQWYGKIELLGLSKSGSNHLERRDVFAMLQGHRFLWWRSLNDFDDGIDPLGFVCLRGHAGLATPSPLEIRQLKQDDLQRLVCIFGRGAEKQERMTFLTTTNLDKSNLEMMIEGAIAKKQD